MKNILFILVFMYTFMQFQLQTFAEDCHAVVTPIGSMGGGIEPLLPYDINLYRESIEKLSDEAKTIALTQMVDLMMISGVTFFQDKEFWLHAKSEIVLEAKDISIYQEGFMVGWAFAIKNFSEKEFSFCAERRKIPGIINSYSGAITLLETEYMDNSPNYGKQGFFFGYLAGKKFAFFSIIESAEMKVYENALSTIKERKRELTPDEQKIILDETPEYEVILFLKEAIKSKDRIIETKQPEPQEDVRDSEQSLDF